MLKKERFTIYRPPKPSNRLEDFLYRDGQWAPSQKYSFTLWDIRNQMTPAEAYRHRLATSGKTIRMLQRLEWRWQKSFELWWKMALRVQSGYRGMHARKYYRSVKKDLLRVKEQREARRAAVELFEQGDKQGALEVLAKVEVMSTELWTIKIKILYSTEQWEACKEACKTVQEIDARCEEAYYCWASILSREKRWNEAYAMLKQLMATVDRPSAEPFRLNALVCSRLRPPKLQEAIESCNMLVEMYPEDLNALLERACMLSCAQDWDAAIKDMTYILLYQPKLTNVRCLRARAYCASRQWDLAKEDYKEVLMLFPHDETAWYGSQDADQPYDPQPMVDHDLVNDAALAL